MKQFMRGWGICWYGNKEVTERSSSVIVLEKHQTNFLIAASVTGSCANIPTFNNRPTSFHFMPPYDA